MKEYEKIRLKVGKQYKDELNALRLENAELEKKLSELAKKHREALKVYNKEKTIHMRESNNTPIMIKSKSVSPPISGSVGNLLSSQTLPLMQILASGVGCALGSGDSDA